MHKLDDRNKHQVGRRKLLSNFILQLVLTFRHTTLLAVTQEMPNNQGDEKATSSPSPPETPSSKVSPFVLKLKSAPPGYFFQPKRPPLHTDPLAVPTGPYFFYGTLSDPAMLRDVLDLETEPRLRPATITGYECKLWGQYPALLDGPKKVIHGAVYHVEIEEYTERLASYETDNY